MIRNKDWYTTGEECVVDILNAHISDHAPLRVKIQGDATSKTHRYQPHFKFMNIVAENMDFWRWLKVIRRLRRLVNRCIFFGENLNNCKLSLGA